MGTRIEKIILVRNDSYNKNKGSMFARKKFEPCGFCKRTGKEGMYHPEKICWFNPKGENYVKSENRKLGPIKIANNSVLSVN